MAGKVNKDRTLSFSYSDPSHQPQERSKSVEVIAAPSTHISPTDLTGTSLRHRSTSSLPYLPNLGASSSTKATSPKTSVLVPTPSPLHSAFMLAENTLHKKLPLKSELKHVYFILDEAIKARTLGDPKEDHVKCLIAQSMLCINGLPEDVISPEDARQTATRCLIMAANEGDDSEGTANYHLGKHLLYSLLKAEPAGTPAEQNDRNNAVDLCKNFLTTTRNRRGGWHSGAEFFLKYIEVSNKLQAEPPVESNLLTEFCAHNRERQYYLRKFQRSEWITPGGGSLDFLSLVEGEDALPKGSYRHNKAMAYLGMDICNGMGNRPRNEQTQLAVRAVHYLVEGLGAIKSKVLQYLIYLKARQMDGAEAPPPKIVVDGHNCTKQVLQEAYEALGQTTVADVTELPAPFFPVDAPSIPLHSLPDMPPTTTVMLNQKSPATVQRMYQSMRELHDLGEIPQVCGPEMLCAEMSKLAKSINHIITVVDNEVGDFNALSNPEAEKSAVGEVINKTLVVRARLIREWNNFHEKGFMVQSVKGRHVYTAKRSAVEATLTVRRYAQVTPNGDVNIVEEKEVIYEGGWERMEEGWGRICTAMDHIRALQGDKLSATELQMLDAVDHGGGEQRMGAGVSGEVVTAVLSTASSKIEMPKDGKGIPIASDPRLGVIVAKKMARPQDDAGAFHVTQLSDRKEQIREEIQILKDIGEHPNIVRMVESENIEGDRPALVMRHEGSTIAEFRAMQQKLRQRDDYRIKDEGVGIGWTLHIMKQVFSGLAHMSQQGYVHTDLHTSNVVINSSGEVRIIDLATSVRKKDNTSGIPPYRVAVYNEQCDEKFDVLRVGILCHGLLAVNPSRFPPDPKRAELRQHFDDVALTQMQAAPARADEGVTEGIRALQKGPLIALIMQCLHVERNKRPSLEDALKEIGRIEAFAPPDADFPPKAPPVA